VGTSRQSVLGFLLVSMFAPANPIYARQAGPIGVRVRDELPGALAKMEEFYVQVKGSGSDTTRTVESSITKFDQHRRFSFAFDNLCKKITLTTREGKETTACETPDTGFTATRTSASDQYVVTDLADAKSTRRPLIRIFEQYLSAPFSVWGVRLSQMMADESFKCTGISEEEVHGRKAVRIKYNYANPKGVMGPGSVVLCPELGWAVLSFDYEFLNNKDPRFGMHGEIEYGEVRDTMPIPRTVKYLVRSGDRTSSNEYEFTEIKHAPTPETEFASTYFGLPDLARPMARRSENYVSYWLLGLAVGAMAVSLLLKYASAHLSRRTGSTYNRA